MTEPSPPSPVRFTWGDFFIVIFAGIAATTVAAAFGGLDPTPGFVFGVALPAQYAGHLLAIAWVVRRRRASAADLGFEAEPSHVLWVGAGVLLQVALALAFLPLLELLGTEESGQSVVGLLTGTTSLAVRLAAVLGVALLAPLSEELIFRGLLLRSLLARRGPVPALVISSLVFAAFHLLGLEPDGFLRAAVVVLLQTFLVGLVLGRLAIRYGNLGRSIFTHAGFNLLAVVLLFWSGTT